MSKIAKTIAVLGVVAGLGVAAMPLSSFAETSASETIGVQVKVNNDIAISASVDNIDFGTMSNGMTKTQNTTVTVESTSDYYLTIAGENGSSDLALIDDTTGNPVTGSGADAIASGTLAAGANSWGYNIDGGSVFTAVPATAGALRGDAANAIDKDDKDTTVTFGIRLDGGAGSLTDGTYKGGVVITATQA